MGESKRRFKINYNPALKPEKVKGAEVQSDGDQMRVTVGKSSKPNFIQPVATIKVVDHGQTPTGRGFLSKRFKR